MTTEWENLRWTKVSNRWHARYGSGAYQIQSRDGGFNVVHFATPKSTAVHLARAETLQGAKDFVEIEREKMMRAVS